ncbi:MAG: hypothetical protein ABSH51_06000 [Solirubrobacteraceae bacterium]
MSRGRARSGGWERAAPPLPASGGDRRLWAVWSRVVVALANQRRLARRISAADCRRCQEAGRA